MQSQFSSLERRFLDNWRSSNDELASDQKKLQEGKKEWQAALATAQVSERVRCVEVSLRVGGESRYERF